MGAGQERRRLSFKTHKQLTGGKFELRFFFVRPTGNGVDKKVPQIIVGYFAAGKNPQLAAELRKADVEVVMNCCSG